MDSSSAPALNVSESTCTENGVFSVTLNESENAASPFCIPNWENKISWWIGEAQSRVHNKTCEVPKT